MVGNKEFFCNSTEKKDLSVLVGKDYEVGKHAGFYQNHKIA